MTLALERAITAGGGAALAEIGAAELARALAQAIARSRSREPDEAGPITLIGRDEIKPRVLRLRLRVGDAERSFVAKRMPVVHAARNELVTRRWLPAVGLAGLAPAILGLEAAADGSWVWHVYEDLGPFELDADSPDPAHVAAVVREIASLHTRFAAHPMLAECRLHGENRDASHLGTMARDAIRALAALDPERLAAAAPDRDGAGLRDRLLARLERLLAEAPARGAMLSECGGAETLLHGDLWTTNTFAEPAGGGIRVRLVDWDRCGVGSASYDLSAFLLRLAPERRDGIVAGYREAIGERAWRLPGRNDLNRLFETAECARYANFAIWPALALLREPAPWAIDQLAEVESWFEALGPALPVAAAGTPGEAA